MIILDPRFVTTSFGFDGYEIVEYLGIVRGIIVRSRSVVGNIGAGLQSLVGGNISVYTKLCEDTRNDSFGLMMEHAQALGANAIIGMRYDANEVAQGITEVLCYGTAVKISKKEA